MSAGGTVLAAGTSAPDFSGSEGSPVKDVSMWCLGTGFSGGPGSTGEWSDLVTLEGFSNINHSVILWNESNGSPNTSTCTHSLHCESVWRKRELENPSLTASFENLTGL